MIEEADKRRAEKEESKAAKAKKKAAKDDAKQKKHIAELIKKKGPGLRRELDRPAAMREWEVVEVPDVTAEGSLTQAIAVEANGYIKDLDVRGVALTESETSQWGNPSQPSSVAPRACHPGTNAAGGCGGNAESRLATVRG